VIAEDALVRPPTPGPFIDAHAHLWTPDVGHYPLAPGFEVEDMNPRSFTAEELLALCRPAGVVRVNLIQMSFYGFTTATCST
jgi:predicted TIM-barrel fold metal-dependent hydrolase